MSVKYQVDNQELKDAINDVLLHKSEWLDRSEKFLDYHVAYRKGGSAISFANALNEISLYKKKQAIFFPFRSTLVYFYENVKRKLPF